MNYRLAIVGHPTSIAEISQIIGEKFDIVEVTGIELSRDEMADSAVQALQSQLSRLDGVLYTRSEPYKLVVSRMDHGSVPARYVNTDAASLTQSLLIAATRFQADIFRVSIDTLDYSTVINTYQSLDISPEEVRPVMVTVDTNAEHFVEAAARSHRQAYRDGLCSICLTNIRSIQDTLASEGIPCVLMTPSVENYINEIRRLILLWEVDSKTTESTAIIRIRANLRSDAYMHQGNMVQSMLNLNRLSETIVMFAQLINGAYFDIGHGNFAIVCSCESLSSISDRFTHLDLLAQVYGTTPYSLDMGIGTGVNLQTALTNAEQAMQRAWVEGGNRAYFVHADGSIVGPIQPNELLNKRQLSFDHQLSKIAQDCSLSLNTVSKIDTFLRSRRSGSFITADLAQELHISFRTAARIVEKLERGNYILEIGRNSINGRGRPTRVYRALW